MRLDFDRVRRHRPAEHDDPAPSAAVCVPVVRRPDGDHLLFTERAVELKRHPGEMSFPGGGREPGDASLTDTALREAAEEVGLAPADAEVLGRLDDVTAPWDLAVRPVVATVPDRDYAPTSREVAAVVALPVAAFVDPEHYESERRVHPEFGAVRLHVFRVGGRVVWGVTGEIVASLLAVAADWTVPPAVDRTVAFDADRPE